MNPSQSFRGGLYQQGEWPEQEKCQTFFVKSQVLRNKCVFEEI